MASPLPSRTRVSQAGIYTVTYDANGNMTSRIEEGEALLLAYDQENRLVEVKRGDDAVIATFTYDADGDRVKSDYYGTVTCYIGNWYEKTGTAETKYYYFAGKRVAMRVGASTWYFLLTDHLGSTARTATSSGTLYGELRYRAWGENRYSWGTTPTTYRFTGQREESTIGLYFYNARWYDAALGRFTQADSLVPSPGNPQSLNRYSYVYNNPLRYTDPTGKFTEDEIMAYFGVETWDEVLKIFMSGGKLAGMWGWLAVLRAAQFGDRITGFRELVDFPKPHPAGYSDDYVFIEYEGGIGIAQDKPGYREHPFDANTWALRSTWAGFLTGGAVYQRYQGYWAIRFDPDKVDWVDVVFDMASLLGLGAARWLREGSAAHGAVENAKTLVGGAQFVKHSQEALAGVRPPNVVLRDIYGILPVIGAPVQLINLIVDLEPGFSVGY